MLPKHLLRRHLSLASYHHLPMRGLSGTIRPHILARYSRKYTTQPDKPSTGHPLDPPHEDRHTEQKLDALSSGNDGFTSSAAIQTLQEWRDKLAIAVRKHADEFTVNAKSRFSYAGMHLNKVTGYDAIEDLKLKVVNQESLINNARNAAKEAKLAYDQAVAQRSHSQREVNDLLHRKSTWTDQDVSRFTTLVREDHLYEQNELRARTAVDESESAVEREFTTLMHTILARYHEEQVWSDKIRSASTYGQMAALGLNLLVFILAIVIVEPWKRKRLAQTFEKKVEQMNVQNNLMFDSAVKELERRFGDKLDSLEGEIRLLIPIAETTITHDTVVAAPPVTESLAKTEEVGIPSGSIDWDNAGYYGGLVGAAAVGWAIHSIIM